uniref:Potassium/proton antiporter CemA n=1 Tax=Lindsaea linearis TaxID=641179 RepID=A0A5B9RE77_9MONI|nr:chloroplast envelope membrane protein [Lindsaea linearis]QEG57359.1 chloroplast envelope membrane protein [Lindsaea linearis]
MIFYYWKWKLIKWFFSTPYRSSDRAYKASKQLQIAKTESSFFRQVGLSPSEAQKSPWIAAALPDAELAVCTYVMLIYCCLLEHRVSVFLLGMQKGIGRLRKPRFLCQFSIEQPHSDLRVTNKFLTKICLQMPTCKSTNNRFFQKTILGLCTISCRGNRIIDEQPKIGSFLENEPEANFYNLNDVKRMNRKLSWIEATLNNFDLREERRFSNRFSFQEELLRFKSAKFTSRAASHEFISLVPRSVSRTLSRFQTELANQSILLVNNDFRLAKNQALASLSYIACLPLLPLTILVSLKTWLLEPQIRGWWDDPQIQIILNSFQEEKALGQLRKVEALLWLDNATINSVDIELRNYDTNSYNETIRLAMMYNESNIQLLLQLVTDVIGMTILALLFVMSQKRLAVPNSWIQESFYSLNDTMKAFSILLLTDLCVGFHSPHGWDILIGAFFEHFGLIPNKYVISHFVSTFPVISDTVFKYWIFRHLNRISPSVVATYHTMNE